MMDKGITFVASGSGEVMEAKKLLTPVNNGLLLLLHALVQLCKNRATESRKR